MRTFTHAVLLPAILTSLFSDSSLALNIPGSLYPSKTSSVHNSSFISQGLKTSVVPSPTSIVFPPHRTGDLGDFDPIWIEPTDSGITAISPSTSTAYLPQNTYGFGGPTVNIVPEWSLTPEYLEQLIKTGEFPNFIKNLYSRDTAPEDVKIIDTKGPQDVKIIDTKGSEDVKIIDTKGSQATISTAPGYNPDDVLIIDRKGPNLISNPTPAPELPPGLSIDDILIIDRKGPNPIPNALAKKYHKLPEPKSDLNLNKPIRISSEYPLLKLISTVDDPVEWIKPDANEPKAGRTKDRDQGWKNPKSHDQEPKAEPQPDSTITSTPTLPPPPPATTLVKMIRS